MAFTSRFPVSLTSAPTSVRRFHSLGYRNPPPAGYPNEMNELSALKVVTKCIEEQYATDPLQKRIVQLEKSKADKKRAAEAAKPQPKENPWHFQGLILH
ncbi:hypothetical protein OPV22_016682 [Ensete ventricosum]|uniref:FRIGIDA-like protein n=1 Tax=Ensete ventricosum TaxID=4639 RepID=A0AAV8QZA1_ENSVE|nr:hypothetical protein OPV22_016682 [Ensete ventricosum]